nr:uncharacterized protein LOC130541467 [Pan paniscus]
MLLRSHSQRRRQRQRRRRRQRQRPELSSLSPSLCAGLSPHSRERGGRRAAPADDASHLATALFPLPLLSVLRLPPLAFFPLPATPPWAPLARSDDAPREEEVGIGERVGAPRAAGLAAAAAAAASTAASELKRGRGGAESSLSCRPILPLTRGRPGELGL